MIQPAEEPLGAPSPLTGDQLYRFRDLLIEEKSKMRESLSRIQREAIQENPDNLGDALVRTHLADLGSETFEQEENFGLAEQFSGVLASIDHALERLDRGRYGICENCGSPIPLERLEAIPSATRCAECQSKVERGDEAA